TVQIAQHGGRFASVRIGGVVDLPAADSLFQQVGAPVGAQPQAPPDNVVLLPQPTFAGIERGANVTTQIHAGLDRRLPASPGAALAGLAIAALAIALPAWRDARSVTVAGQRAEVGRRDCAPWWARAGLDFAALTIAGLVYWQASRNGYKLVLAPEGVPQVSVNWYSLLAPVLGWVGIGLLAYRLADLLLRRRRRRLTGSLRPVAGELAPTVAATMGRQRRLLAKAVALVALTAAFAASTAVFDSTYQQQANVDARLTNGADVSVIESPGARVGPRAATQIAHVGRVKSVEPLQH